MPRQSRIDTPGALHHVICRGIGRRKIFVDDIDRQNFVSRLGGILSDTSTRCFAWALLPNHFHLLLQTGPTPVSTVMRRLLTGHAAAFNRRHRRHGHLFQNRYKSILCQEEPYLLELVRYIHLNPLRARLVATAEELKSYPWCGHRHLLGTEAPSWMAPAAVLGRFSDRQSSAKEAYTAFVAEGVTLGKRPELSGGGLVRSAGGWQQVKEGRKDGLLLKSDERILGDSDFVDEVLSAAEESLIRQQQYAQQGLDLESLVHLVAKAQNIDTNEVVAAGKQPQRVAARSLLCYWAVRELGMTTMALARSLPLTQPAISIAVKRGEQIAGASGLNLTRLIGGNL